MELVVQLSLLISSGNIRAKFIDIIVRTSLTTCLLNILQLWIGVGVLRMWLFSKLLLKDKLLATIHNPLLISLFGNLFSLGRGVSYFPRVVFYLVGDHVHFTPEFHFSRNYNKHLAILDLLGLLLVIILVDDDDVLLPAWNFLFCIRDERGEGCRSYSSTNYNHILHYIFTAFIFSVLLMEPFLLLWILCGKPRTGVFQ